MFRTVSLAIAVDLFTGVCSFTEKLVSLLDVADCLSDGFCAGR